MNQRIKALDGIRAVAILLVLAGHLLGQYGMEGSSWWTEIVGNASLGVRLFFVLSGFLITSLLQTEFAQHGKISLGKFWARRSIRILPAFYVYLAVIAWLAYTNIFAVSGQQLTAAATYTWNYHALWISDAPAQGQWFLGHLWTLSLEEQFYLVWPLVLIGAGWKIAKHASWIIPLVLPVVRIACYYLFPNQRGYLGMMFHTAIDSILVGCAFALWREPIQAWLSQRKWITTLALGYVFLLAPVLSFYFRSYRITLGFGLEALCAGVLLLQLCAGGKLSTLLSASPLVWLGRLSYSLYLWQQLFLTNYQPKPQGGFPLNLLCAFGAAVASYYLVEMPCLKLKRRFERVHLA